MNGIGDSTLISDINIPGTHDSCAKHVALHHLTKCQNKYISELLDMGVRLFDIRICKQGDNIIIVHAVIVCKKCPFGKPILFDDVLDTCRDFLTKNPSETVILSIKRDSGPDDISTYKFFHEKYVRENSLWYTGASVPTLGEVRGKLVLFNRNRTENFEKDEVGLDFGSWEEMSKEEIGNPVFRKFPLTGEEFVIQDLYKSHPADKWKAVLSLLNAALPEKLLTINFLSGNDTIHSPRVYSRYINRKFMNYPLTSGKKYGWLLLDYADSKLIDKIVTSNKRK